MTSQYGKAFWITWPFVRGIHWSAGSGQSVSKTTLHNSSHFGIAITSTILLSWKETNIVIIYDFWIILLAYPSFGAIWGVKHAMGANMDHCDFLSINSTKFQFHSVLHRTSQNHANCEHQIKINNTENTYLFSARTFMGNYLLCYEWREVC